MGTDAADAYIYMQNNPIPNVNEKMALWVSNYIIEWKKPSLVASDQLIEMGFKNVTDNMVFNLNLTLKTDSIQSENEISHFLAQSVYESGWGESLTENDNAAGTYLKSKNYYPYYGAGYIQLTGEKNYEAFSIAMGDPRILSEGPGYVAANYAWQAAGWWWDTAGMNGKIVSGYTIDNVSGQVTAWNKNAKDNGSYQTRRNNYSTIYGVLTR